MNRARITDRLLQAIWACENAQSATDDPFLKENGEQLDENIGQASRAFCGSWIGYHSTIYYRDLDTPQPGDHFTPEWGLMPGLMSNRVSENWVEYSQEDIRAALMTGVAEGYKDKLSAASAQARCVLKEHLDSVRTIVEVLLKNDETHALQRINDELSKIQPELTAHNVIRALRPSGQFMTRDMTAMSQGIIAPAHCLVYAEQVALRHPFVALKTLTECANRTLNYMEINDLIERPSIPPKGRVFIGHGRSPLWRELKDFLQDRLHLSWEEFNRSPAAGMATSERLQEMLDNSCFALLLMTAEDQHADQSLHARENVVHEVGLFQAKLGFRRAIIILEEDCTEFSNITGLTQIRFPPGNIAACFEELRRVLEREGLGEFGGHRT